MLEPNICQSTFCQGKENISNISQSTFQIFVIVKRKIFKTEEEHWRNGRRNLEDYWKSRKSLNRRRALEKWKKKSKVKFEKI